MLNIEKEKQKPRSKTSRIPSFHKLSISERLEKIAEFCSLNDFEMELLKKPSSLRLDAAETMVENVISTMPYPLCIAPNFLINDKEYLVPMVTEETSVVAGAANAAKKTRSTGGFKVKGYDRAITTSQIQLINIKNIAEVVNQIKSHKTDIIALSNKELKSMVARGGGAQDLSIDTFEKTKSGPMVVINIEIDCKDAQGANVAIRTAEAVAPYIEKITHEKTNLKILSNLSPKRLVKATAIFPKEEIGGENVVDRVVHASALAEVDIYRTATHNKGIINGLCALALATANDLPALEAGIHAYAAMNGKYKSLSEWSKNDSGDLVGTLEIPIQVGTIGGLISVHPIAQIALKILGNPNAKELSEVMAAVGLAQNAAALINLSDKGMVHGHLKLHAKNIAKMAGSGDKELRVVTSKMIEEGNITITRAKEILQEIRV